MKKIREVLALTGLTVSLLLSGCTSREGKITTEAEDAIRQLLNDPDGAKFKDVFLTKTEKYVCGQVNEKNSTGGYDGFRLFVVEVKKHENEMTVGRTYQGIVAAAHSQLGACSND